MDAAEEVIAAGTQCTDYDTTTCEGAADFYCCVLGGDTTAAVNGTDSAAVATNATTTAEDCSDNGGLLDFLSE